MDATWQVIPILSPARKRAAFTSFQSARPAPAWRKWAWASINTGFGLSAAGGEWSRPFLVSQFDEGRVRGGFDFANHVVRVRDRRIVVGSALEEHALPRRELEESRLPLGRIESEHPHVVDAVDGDAMDAARIDHGGHCGANVETNRSK